jgi:hypothetical protein
LIPFGTILLIATLNNGLEILGYKNIEGINIKGLNKAKKPASIFWPGYLLPQHTFLNTGDR